MDAIAPPVFGGPAVGQTEALTRRAASLRDTAEIDRVAREFERMALSQMLAQIGQDADISDTLFGGGAGERAFQPLLTDEYARGFAQQGGIGIADAVRREMLRMQEMTRPAGQGG